MDSSSKDGSCYIDGLPLKISPKFYPPRPVALPLTLDTRTPSDLFTEQYDFSLERSVIDYVEKRQAKILEAKEKPVPKTDSSGDLQEPELVSKPVLPWQPDTILQPQPQQPVEQAPSPPQDNIKINLSDFENDTSSPFDYMELQTINDLEELNSVFQGIHDKDTQAPVQEDPQCEGPPAAVSKSISFPLPRGNRDPIPGSLSEDFMSGVRNGFNYPRDLSCDSSTLPQVPYVAAQQSGAWERPQPLLRGCKSYSDIRSLNDEEVPLAAKERSKTPPTTIPEPHEEVLQFPLNEDYFSRESTESSNGVSECDTSAYEELDEAAKHFVDCITEMGFVKGQVARAVKHLGTDEKKVVEHLCQIQFLEESGYESSEAEAALHLHDYNREQAKAFLDLVIRFQDLGFEKDAVKKALVQNKNDWNKTIDALLP